MEETFEFERDGRKFVVEAKRFFDEWLGKEKVTADIFEVTEPGSKKLRAPGARTFDHRHGARHTERSLPHLPEHA